MGSGAGGLGGTKRRSPCWRQRQTCRVACGRHWTGGWGRHCGVGEPLARTGRGVALLWTPQAPEEDIFLRVLKQGPSLSALPGPVQTSKAPPLPSTLGRGWVLFLMCVEVWPGLACG